MKIAITGGTGLLGKYFIRSLSEKGVHTPIILTRRQTVPDLGTEYRTTDYSFNSLIKALTDIDAVVHLAAERGKYSSIKDYNINIDITQNLYDACRINNIPNIVYASTISVYSEETLLPWKEDQIPSPVSMYGISKLSGELLGNLYNHQHNLCIKNLRFAHLYGCNEQNEYMINKFMRQAYKKQKLVLFSNQSANREFLYAKDAASAIVDVLEAKEEHGTFNVGSNEALTNQKVAETINRAFGNEGNLRIEFRKEKEIKSSYMNNKKIYYNLGFEPKYSFYEAMLEISREIQDV